MASSDQPVGKPKARTPVIAVDAMAAENGFGFAPWSRVGANVLVIADHAEIATLITRYLAGAGYCAVVTSDLRQAALVVAREAPGAIVIDLAAPGHAESILYWLRRDPTRAAMAIVRANARLRHAGTGRVEMAGEIQIPKPFTPRQVVDAVRIALARRAARERAFVPPARTAV